MTINNILAGVEDLLHLGLGQKRAKEHPSGNLYKGIRSGFKSKEAGLTFRAGFAAGTKGLLRTGWNNSAAGWWMLQGPVSLLQAGMAPRGNRLSAGFGAAVPSVVAGVASMLGGPLAGFAASMLLDGKVQKALTEGAQTFVDLNRNVARLNMGGNFRDSQAAYTMRAKASQEMNHSLLGARQHLGREALLMNS